MGALDKFKSFFFGPKKAPIKVKGKKRPHSHQAHLKIVESDHKSQQANATQDKQDIRVLQARINQKISRDPRLATNAALIIEKMLHKK